MIAPFAMLAAVVALLLIIIHKDAKIQNRREADRILEFAERAEKLYPHFPRLEALQYMYAGTYRLLLRKKSGGKDYEKELSDCVLLHNMINTEIRREAEILSEYQTETHLSL